MRDYDNTLKSALERLTGSVVKPLSGIAVTRWHNGELPAVRNRRADMLGQAGDGTLLHIELQSTNHVHMAQRMLDYASAIRWKFGRFPEQMVLYVGSARLRMKEELTGPRLKFRCRMVDIRELDGERLIASRRVEDNVFAVLAGLGDERDAIRRILGAIAGCPPTRREKMLRELMTLAGLRKLNPVIEKEARQMPILNDILDDEVFGPLIRRGREEGLQEGREEGREEVLAGQRTAVLKLIGQRFGPVKPEVRKRIEALSPTGLSRVNAKVLKASSIDDLLR